MVLPGRNFYKIQLLCIHFCKTVLPVNNCTYGLYCQKKAAILVTDFTWFYMTQSLHKVLMHEVQRITSIFFLSSHRAIQLMTNGLRGTFLNNFRRNDDQKFSRHSVITPELLITIYMFSIQASKIAFSGFVHIYVPWAVTSPCQTYAHRHLRKEVRFNQRIQQILSLLERASY